jgi:HK97 family phage major capsid protein
MKWYETLKLKFDGDMNLRAMTVDELKEHKASVIKGLRAFLDSCDAESRDLKQTEADAYGEAEKHLDAVEKELGSRPSNNVPLTARYVPGESAPGRPPVWGGIGLRYEELFNDGQAVSQEDPEQFLARAFSQRTMSVNVSVDGGGLVPSQLWASVYNLAVQKSICMPRMRVFPMAATTLTVPAFSSEDESQGWTAGLRGQWRKEGQSFDSQVPKVRNINYVADKFGLYIVASNEILADAPSLQSVVGGIMVDTVAREIDHIVINGTGQVGPQGILNSPCSLDVSRATASQISYNDVVQIFSKLEPSMISEAIFIGSPSILPQLCTIQDAAGRYIWQPSASGGVDGPCPGTLMGRPLMLTTSASQLGTRGDLMLVALNHYGFALRKSATVESSQHALFSSDQVAFRCIMRCDGSFLLPSKLTGINGEEFSCAVVLD